MKTEADVSRRAVDARPPPASRRSSEPAFDKRRYANYELFRLAPDIQSGLVLRRATPVEVVEFFKVWGAQVHGQFEQGARAQLH